jgi:hypothetical protein
MKVIPQLVESQRSGSSVRSCAGPHTALVLRESKLGDGADIPRRAY